jgi:hypothetical protein
MQKKRRAPDAATWGSFMTKLFLAAGAALAFALVPAGEAMAAQGVFSYQNVYGDELELGDPDNGECYLLVGGMEWAFNDTDALAFVYEDHGCEGPAFMMFPGGVSSYPDPVPHSVMFR